MNTLLAKDLKIAKEKARENIIQSKDLPKGTFQRLNKLEWLSQISRGWYILKTPAVKDGESTLWYANFWSFLKYYLQEHYQNDYCLNPVSSIYLKTESGVIPDQIIVMLKSGGQTLKLPFGTSVLLYTEKKNFPEQIENLNGLNIIELTKALTMVPESFFSNYENEAELALCMVRSPSDLTKHLMDNGQPAKAEVLAGAYEFLKKNDFVEQIKADMALLAYTIRPKNPFAKAKPTLSTTRVLSPAVARIEMLWAFHRESIIKNFPTPDPKKLTIEEVIQNIKEIYVHDAYNSLSIEGYSVTEELIQRISDGTFDTLTTEADKKEEAAMAAKGYYLAFTEVTRFIKENYGKMPSETKLKREVQNWYKQLFTPKVQAGLAMPSLLVGYRNKPVFIRGSKHVPVNFSVVGEVMEKFLELLDNETSPEVRAVLGHFMLVFIHPFPDGNGRTSRFIMNASLILAGHNWTVIRNKKKAEYFKALEQASVHSKIEEFVEFIVSELNISKAHSKVSKILS